MNGSAGGMFAGTTAGVEAVVHAGLAGAKVELLGIGNSVTSPKLEPGTAGPIGTGRVTSDGDHVESDPAVDSGLVTFGWIGYRSVP